MDVLLAAFLVFVSGCLPIVNACVLFGTPLKLAAEITASLVVLPMLQTQWIVFAFARLGADGLWRKCLAIAVSVVFGLLLAILRLDSRDLSQCSVTALLLATEIYFVWFIESVTSRDYFSMSSSPKNSIRVPVSVHSAQYATEPWLTMVYDAFKNLLEIASVVALVWNS